MCSRMTRNRTNEGIRSSGALHPVQPDGSKTGSQYTFDEMLKILGTSLSVYPRTKAKKAFSCWRRWPAGRMWRGHLAGLPCSVRISGVCFRNWSFPLRTSSGTSGRGPLHIPPLRRGPSPAGEGFLGFQPRVYGFARAFWCRQSVPPLISLGCAEPASPKGKLQRESFFTPSFRRLGPGRERPPGPAWSSAGSCP